MASLINKLSLALLAGVIAAVGLVLPANAAPVTNTSVSSAGAVSGSTNPNPIVITATFPTGGVAKAINVELPTGWSWVTPMTYSSYPNSPGALTAITGYTPTLTGNLNSGGPLGLSNASLWLNMSSGTIAANTTVTITLGQGTVNVGSGVTFTISSTPAVGTPPVAVTDQSSVNLNGASSTSTVTFDSNGGTGSTASQTASSATALTANGFSRAGYIFVGWNTAADGSGTAYADGASYAFNSSITLYAQWTATLANTGFDGVPYLVGGLALAAIGGGLVFFARRKQSN
jgi:uncharacterized repeat protein (TIGR02543 family)/LPXTG-motif cell wall-anchored protein